MKERFSNMNRRDFIKTTGMIGGATILAINPLDALIAEAAFEPMSSATLAVQEKLYAAANWLPLGEKEIELIFVAEL